MEPVSVNKNTHLCEVHARALARQPRVLAQKRVLAVHRQEMLRLDKAQHLLQLVLVFKSVVCVFVCDRLNSAQAGSAAA